MFKLNRAVISALSVVALLSAGIAATPAVAAPSDKKAKNQAKAGDAIVLMETTKGPIKLVIYKNEVPQTAYNFMDLVGKGFYDGLSFHRYEPGFCIQGGDPEGTGTGNYVDPKTKQVRRIPLEVKPNLKHDGPGVLAMARSQSRNSASCQFISPLALPAALTAIMPCSVACSMAWTL